MTLTNTFISNTELGIDLAVLVIKGTPSIHFTINNSTNIVTTNRLAITKWLVRTTKELQSKYTYLETVACNADGKGEYRVKLFSKLGFVRTSDADYYMEWRAN